MAVYSMRSSEEYHCIFASGEQCRATFRVESNEVVYRIRWINVERVYGTLEKEADVWIESCIRQFLQEHPECESLPFRHERR
jgi:hypothetical protein